MSASTRAAFLIRLRRDIATPFRYTSLSAHKAPTLLSPGCRPVYINSSVSGNPPFGECRVGFASNRTKRRKRIYTERLHARRSEESPPDTSKRGDADGRTAPA